MHDLISQKIVGSLSRSNPRAVSSILISARVANVSVCLTSIADIEQVQNEKKPFTLRCMPCRTTQPNSGEGHRWKRSGSNVWIISDSSCLSSKIDASLR